MSVTVHLNDRCGSFSSSFLRIRTRNANEVGTFFHRFLQLSFTVCLPFGMAHSFRPPHSNLTQTLPDYDLFFFRKCTNSGYVCMCMGLFPVVWHGAVQSSMVNFSFANAWLNGIYTLLCIKSTFGFWMWANRRCSPVRRHYLMNLNHLGLRQ